MAWFENTYEDTRSLKCDAATAAAHFADTDVVVAATKGVEASTLEDGVLHLDLAEEDHGVMKFKGSYRCRYVQDGNTVRWETLDGNVDQSGEARFEPAADGCTMHYRETVKLDLDMPSMMAPMLRPVIAALISNEVKDYLKRITASL